MFSPLCKIRKHFAIIFALSACLQFCISGSETCMEEQRTYGVSINGYTIQTISGIGFQMCLDECQRTVRCKSIDFDRNDFKCELKSKALNDTSNKLQAPNNWHVDIANWNISYSSYSTHSCQIGEECVNNWCIPLECPNIPTIKNAVSTSTDGRKFGSIVTYQCIDGYTGSGNPNGTCSSRGTWSYRYTCDKQINDWILVARFKSQIGVSAYNTWFSTGTASESDVSVEEGCTSMNYADTCTTHYRSGLIDSWNTLSIAEVKVELFSSGELVANITFNGTATTNSDWFSKTKYISSGWTDINNENQNYFSIDGNRAYGGCNVDTGWMVTAEQVTYCSWENQGDIPKFVYSPNNTYTTYESSLFMADVMAISIKLNSWP